MKTIEGKKIASILLALIFALGIAAGAVFADDALTPDIGAAAADSGDENFIQYLDNYALDTEKLSFFKDPMATVFDGGANALFVMQKGIATVQIYLFQIALESNVLELLEEFISPFIDSMRVYIFDSFSSVFIVICGVLLLLKLAVNRHAQAIS
ncbi:MAG: hypothetical protein K0Q48_3190, partial [Bacillota bacterium]|nr:hypothetical protein [Bacillota bacterium]